MAELVFDRAVSIGDIVRINGADFLEKIARFVEGGLEDQRVAELEVVRQVSRVGFLMDPGAAAGVIGRALRIRIWVGVVDRRIRA